jgi:hypothetical protein
MNNVKNIESRNLDYFLKEDMAGCSVGMRLKLQACTEVAART